MPPTDLWSNSRPSSSIDTRWIAACIPRGESLRCTHRTGLVAVGVIVAAFVVLSGLSAASVALADSGQHNDPQAAMPTAENTTVTVGDSPHTATSAPGENASREATQLLVSFDSVAERPETSLEYLQAQANATQRPLERYASETSGLTVERNFWLGNTALVSFDPNQTSVETLLDIDGVTELSPNDYVFIERTQHDTPVQTELETRQPHVDDGMPVTEFSTATTYGLDQVNAPAVWSTHDTMGEGTSVAVLDTGADPTHPDIELEAWGDWYSDGEPRHSNPQDYDDNPGHGTHVSGTVAGGDASGQSIGVAPETDLYHGAVLTDCTETSCGGTVSQVLAGMEWAVEHDVDVVSMSLGSPGQSGFFVDAIRDANALGTTVVASAGNAGEGTGSTPGSEYDAIAVGASDEDEEIAEFSSGRYEDKSDWLDAPEEWPAQWTTPTVAAPGVAVTSAVAGGEHESLWGTSMAAPHVSGVVALLQSATDQTLSTTNIRDALTQTATTPPGTSPDPNNRYGHGIVDAMAALASDATASGQIHGTVTDADGSPIADADIALVHDQHDLASVETDENGTYSFAAPTGSHRLTADSPAHEPANTSVAVTPNDDIELNVSLSLETAEVAGVVTDDASNPLSDAQVILSTDGDQHTNTTTDENGAYALEVPAETYTVTVEKPGYEESSEPISLDPGGQTVHNATLEALDGTVTGTVTGEDDSAIAAANVTLFDEDIVVASTETADTGEFTLQAPPGSYELVAEKLGFASHSSEIHIEPGDTQHRNVTLSAHEPGTVTGLVTDQADVELADVELRFYHEDTLVETATTNGSGVYETTLPPVTYDGVVDKAEYGAPILDVTITKNDTTVLDVALPDGPPPLPGVDNAPQDLTNDGLYEDINGDGVFDIFDVQALFTTHQTKAAQANAEFFDFALEDPATITIFDVQALFEQLQDGD